MTYIFKLSTIVQHGKIIFFLIFLFLGTNLLAQTSYITSGIYYIFKEYSTMHWKDADSISDILTHVNNYPPRKKKDLAASIAYLSERHDYTYYVDADSLRCYFDSDICYFSYSQFEGPCLLEQDTSTWAITKKLRIRNVCVDSIGNVVYDALPSLESAVGRIKRHCSKSPYRDLDLHGWTALIARKGNNDVLCYCTQEKIENSLSNYITRELSSFWKKHKEVEEIRFCVVLP